MGARARRTGSCSNPLDFEADALLEAIDATFSNRETPVPAEEFESFTTDFVKAHRVQWNAFVKKMGEDELIDAFGKIVEHLKRFVMPVFRSISRDEKLAPHWKAGRGWAAS